MAVKTPSFLGLVFATGEGLYGQRKKGKTKLTKSRIYNVSRSKHIQTKKKERPKTLKQQIKHKTYVLRMAQTNNSEVSIFGQSLSLLS